MARNTERSKPDSKQESAEDEHLHLKVQNAVEANALWTSRWCTRLPFSFPLCSANKESESATAGDPEKAEADEAEEDGSSAKLLLLLLRSPTHPAEEVAEVRATFVRRSLVSPRPGRSSCSDDSEQCVSRTM